MSQKKSWTKASISRATSVKVDKDVTKDKETLGVRFFQKGISSTGSSHNENSLGGSLGGIALNLPPGLSVPPSSSPLLSTSPLLSSSSSSFLEGGEKGEKESHGKAEVFKLLNAHHTPFVFHPATHIRVHEVFCFVFVFVFCFFFLFCFFFFLFLFFSFFFFFFLSFPCFINFFFIVIHYYYFSSHFFE